MNDDDLTAMLYRYPHAICEGSEQAKKASGLPDSEIVMTWYHPSSRRYQVMLDGANEQFPDSKPTITEDGFLLSMTLQGAIESMGNSRSAMYFLKEKVPQGCVKLIVFCARQGSGDAAAFSHVPVCNSHDTTRAVS